MSIELARKEIERFLRGTEPEVLCISGKWGVGKTYSWNYFLKAARDAREVRSKRYSYVSLFGLKTVNDLKYALFEATKPIEKAGEGFELEDLAKDDIFTLAENPMRKITALLTKLTKVQSYIGVTENFLFATVRRQLICIDDLERAGNGLDVIDVFGLISFLKEQRDCRIVLLLNEQEISEGQQKDIFKKQFEKVVDTSLQFEPSPQEAADIVFPDAKNTQKDLRSHVATLGIVNIRVIKKIEKIAMRLEEILQDKYAKLVQQAVHSATLFAWGKYQKDDVPPPFDFLQDISRLHGFNRNKNQEGASGNDGRWATLMSDYKFASMDDFDLVIHNIVESGIFDDDKLLNAAEKQSQGVAKAQQEKVIHEAWSLYHDSFDDNENEVMNKIFEVSMDNIGAISPSNLDATVKTLREFNRNEEASKLIEKYVSERASEEYLFSKHNSVFDQGPRDTELVKAFEKVRTNFVDNRNPVDVLENMILKRGWDLEDEELINKLSTEEFYEIFKAEKANRLHHVIRAARQLSNRNAEGKSIAERAVEALSRISKENRLNAKRVSAQGV